MRRPDQHRRAGRGRLGDQLPTGDGPEQAGSDPSKHAARLSGGGRTSRKDAVGNELADGDTVTIVKDLKVKGAGGGTVKVGTKVKGIRLITDGVGDHDIDAKVPGFGQMQLKSSVVKKVL
nr:alkylphosphonate utilization protein [Nocardioides sp.]